jgi:hypothetical protein
MAIHCLGLFAVRFMVFNKRLGCSNIQLAYRVYRLVLDSGKRVDLVRPLQPERSVHDCVELKVNRIRGFDLL